MTEEEKVSKDDWPEDWWKIAAETLEIPLEEPASVTAAPPRERWLNGWRRHGDSVFIGTGAHCAGCGKFLGLICIALDGTPWPEKNPDFPFEEATCPLCALRRVPDPPGAVDKLTERLERLRERDSVAVEAERTFFIELCERVIRANNQVKGDGSGINLLMTDLINKIRARGAEKGKG